jgi:hypothetical protein
MLSISRQASRMYCLLLLADIIPCRTLTIWPLAVAVDDARCFVIKYSFIPGIVAHSYGWLFITCSTADSG